MNFSRNWNVLISILLGVGLLSAAELYARKMAIVRTVKGQATILRDSVAIIDGETVIHCRHAKLTPSQDHAVLWDSVLITTPEVLVQADSVEYFFPEHRLGLFARSGEEVLIRQESVEIRSPAIEYALKEGVVKTSRRFELTGISKSFILTGEKGCYFVNSRSGSVDSNPVLTLREDDGDSVVITAENMQYFDGEGLLKASDSVQIRFGTGQLLCDRAVFFIKADSGIAWGQPQLRDSSGEAKGETLVFYLSDRSLKQVSLHGEARGEYRTEAGETVLVNGSALSMLLNEGRIEEIVVDNLISGQLIRKRE